MALIDYTTKELVFAYGAQLTPNAAQQSVMATLVTNLSRSLDTWLNQVFAEQTYTDVVERAQIDPDGLLQCWPGCPTMSMPTALAWKLGTQTTWKTLDLSTAANYEIEESNNGCRFRVLSPSFLGYRGNRVQMRLSFTGGWATLNDVPGDFQHYATRIAWTEFKKRESSEVGKTAIPEMGIVIIPQAWPVDVKAGFASYKRVVLI